MAITYPLTMPSATQISRVTMRPRTKVAMTMSEFTGKQQVQKHQGQWWEAEVSLPPMLRDDAEDWLAFLTKLNGMEGTFLFGDPAFRNA